MVRGAPQITPAQELFDFVNDVQAFFIRRYCKKGINVAVGNCKMDSKTGHKLSDPYNAKVKRRGTASLRTWRAPTGQAPYLRRVRSNPSLGNYHVNGQGVPTCSLTHHSFHTSNLPREAVTANQGFGQSPLEHDSLDIRLVPSSVPNGSSRV